MRVQSLRSTRQLKAAETYIMDTITHMTHAEEQIRERAACRGGRPPTWYYSIVNLRPKNKQAHCLMLYVLSLIARCVEPDLLYEAAADKH